MQFYPLQQPLSGAGHVFPACDEVLIKSTVLEGVLTDGRWLEATDVRVTLDGLDYALSLHTFIRQ